jgi:hypothetical protein
VWNRFDDAFLSSDVMEAADHNLLLMTSNSKGTGISKVDEEGVVKQAQALPADAYFMRPLAPTSRVRVGYMVDTFKTEFSEFDQELRGPTHVVRVENVGIQKGYELADGSLIVFGSTFRNNAVPNIARVYKDAHITNFAVAPPMEAGWIIDAVPTGSPNQYVYVTFAGENPVMAWVTVHAN